MKSEDEITPIAPGTNITYVSPGKPNEELLGVGNDTLYIGSKLHSTATILGHSLSSVIYEPWMKLHETQKLH